MRKQTKEMNLYELVALAREKCAGLMDPDRGSRNFNIPNDNRDYLLWYVTSPWEHFRGVWSFEYYMFPESFKGMINDPNQFFKNFMGVSPQEDIVENNYFFHYMLNVDKIWKMVKETVEIEKSLGRKTFFPNEVIEWFVSQFGPEPCFLSSFNPGYNSLLGNREVTQTIMNFFKQSRQNVIDFGRLIHGLPIEEKGSYFAEHLLVNAKRIYIVDLVEYPRETVHFKEASSGERTKGKQQ